MTLGSDTGRGITLPWARRSFSASEAFRWGARVVHACPPPTMARQRRKQMHSLTASLAPPVCWTSNRRTAAAAASVPCHARTLATTSTRPGTAQPVAAAARAPLTRAAPHVCLQDVGSQHPRQGGTWAAAESARHVGSCATVPRHTGRHRPCASRRIESAAAIATTLANLAACVAHARGFEARHTQAVAADIGYDTVACDLNVRRELRSSLRPCTRRTVPCADFLELRVQEALVVVVQSVVSTSVDTSFRTAELVEHAFKSSHAGADPSRAAGDGGAAGDGATSREPPPLFERSFVQHTETPRLSFVSRTRSTPVFRVNVCLTAASTPLPTPRAGGPADPIARGLQGGAGAVAPTLVKVEVEPMSLCWDVDGLLRWAAAFSGSSKGASAAVTHVAQQVLVAAAEAVAEAGGPTGAGVAETAAGKRRGVHRGRDGAAVGGGSARPPLGAPRRRTSVPGGDTGSVRTTGASRAASVASQGAQSTDSRRSHVRSVKAALRELVADIATEAPEGTAAAGPTYLLSVDIAYCEAVVGFPGASAVEFVVGGWSRLLRGADQRLGVAALQGLTRRSGWRLARCCWSCRMAASLRLPPLRAPGTCVCVAVTHASCGVSALCARVTAQHWSWHRDGAVASVPPAVRS